MKGINDFECFAVSISVVLKALVPFRLHGNERLNIAKHALITSTYYKIKYLFFNKLYIMKKIKLILRN